MVSILKFSVKLGSWKEQICPSWKIRKGEKPYKIILLNIKNKLKYTLLTQPDEKMNSKWKYGLFYSATLFPMKKDRMFSRRTFWYNFRLADCRWNKKENLVEKTCLLKPRGKMKRNNYRTKCQISLDLNWGRRIKINWHFKSDIQNGRFLVGIFCLSVYFFHCLAYSISSPDELVTTVTTASLDNFNSKIKLSFQQKLLHLFDLLGLNLRVTLKYLIVFPSR